MTKTLPWAASGAARPLSSMLLHLLAAALMSASALLTRLAARLAAAEQARNAAYSGTVEFHALYGEAGAPEGALYVNGRLVGVVPGVKRL